MKNVFLFCIACLSFVATRAESGYELWLRYKPIPQAKLGWKLPARITICAPSQSETGHIIQTELKNGLAGMLGSQCTFQSTIHKQTHIIVRTAKELPQHLLQRWSKQINQLRLDGYLLIADQRGPIIVTARSTTGLLYGTYGLLRQIGSGKSIQPISQLENPSLPWRMLNHWDNLDRTVERGYAGFSIWNWHTLPDFIDKRYIDYARANASLGINAVVLNNVNANALILTPTYLEKVQRLAEVFRPYGIRVFLTARFSAPIEIGGLPTADPLNSDVVAFWKEKVKLIYSLIPDFGGFLVKANSEGQPGPQDYNRTHADGANLLADALTPFGGTVIWRAFVYSAENPDDRHKQAYVEFLPLDGAFRSNVILQIKNGAIDFMPREPFHPLFGALQKTPVCLELQVTQEYLGQATNLVFLGPLFEEVLAANTHGPFPNPLVRDVITGAHLQQPTGGIAGVANIGTDINWCGHPIAQANWYALGRFAWNPTLTAKSIAQEWIHQSFGHDTTVNRTLEEILLASREIYVSYTHPLGLHHLIGTGHHYGPAPWVNNLARAEWNPVYYHRADQTGIGFDRTTRGSNALSQYQPPVRAAWEDPHRIEPTLLLWFHRVRWQDTLKSTQQSLWQSLANYYQQGVDGVTWMTLGWKQLRGKIDEERFEQVRQLLQIQQKEAIWWRNACLLYFQSINQLPWPKSIPIPEESLTYYKNLSFPFAPGHH